MRISKIFEKTAGLKNVCRFAVTLSALTLATSLHADWSNPQIVSPSGNQYPAIALDQDSNSTVGWVDGALTGVFSGAQPSGYSSWGFRGVIAEGQYEYSSPSIFVDAFGNKTAVWATFDGSYYSLQAATQSALDAYWSDPVVMIFGDSNSKATYMNVNADSSGNIVASWITPQVYGAPPLVLASTLPAGNSAWTAPVELAQDPDNTLTQAPSIAFSNGLAYVMWKINSPSLTLQTGTLDFSSGLWSQLPDLSLASLYDDVSSWQIAVDPNGNSTLLASAVSSDTQNNVVISTQLAAWADDWSDVQLLSDPVMQSSDSIYVESDTQGNVVALWTVQDQSTGLYTVQSANMPFGQSFEGSTILSDAFEYIFNLQLAVDSQGDVAAVWATTDCGTQSVQTANQPFQGYWSDVQTLSESGTNPSIAVNDQNLAVAVWQDTSSDSPSIMAATNDSIFQTSDTSDSYAMADDNTYGYSSAFSSSSSY